jgi:enoyl-[acyl-carrier protein] reductase/trans-2-enoyl-CoA reductase (NAD+)
MIIKPSIRSNVFTNAHPLGCKANLEKQINELHGQPSFDGPKNVLIIGGSSGYGLASRIALAFKGSSNTINVSFESGPKGKRSGTAGWWNNHYFKVLTEGLPTSHKDFIGDAFSKAMKEEVIEYIKATLGKIDLVIYSLASGGRKNEETGEVVRSSIKAIGETVEGKTIDIVNKTVESLTIEEATNQEILDTVYVMGGNDWQQWIHALKDNDLINQRFKTISYTYIGGPTTEKIYRKGTLGKAKEDLELKAKTMNQWLSENYKGEALISSSKAVVTKASVFIPQMPIYVAALFDVMMKKNLHETIVAHKYRLFKDMVYGQDRIVDEEGRIRLDHLEMQEDVQVETVALMGAINDKTLFDLKGTHQFFEDFYQIHGFNFESIDYEASVDLDQLAKE